MSKFFKHLSKTMSHALRHAPHQYGLTLDKNGWATLASLISGLQSASYRWKELDKETIEAMIAASEKQRFEIEGDRVRAIYGHSSQEIDISYPPAEPPEILYHGTTPNAALLIKSSGLTSQQRKFVHLSPDVETALVVARRRTNSPVVIKVLALEAHQSGTGFYFGHDSVWLADDIHADFLVFEKS